MLITIHRCLLPIFWGPRRATSSKRYGKVKAYPRSVTASHSLWWKWFKLSLKEWLTYDLKVVFQKPEATKRIQDQLKTQEQKPLLTPSEIQVLLEERENLRKEKKFLEADAIRDKLKEAGVEVKDSKIT